MLNNPKSTKSTRMYEIIGVAFTLNPMNDDGRIRCALKDIVASLGTSESELWTDLLTLAKTRPLVIETSDTGDISLTFVPGKFDQASTASTQDKRAVKSKPRKKAGKAKAKTAARHRAVATTPKNKSARAPLVASAENETKVLEAVKRIGQDNAPANPMPKTSLAKFAGVPKGSIHGILQRLAKNGRITATERSSGQYEFVVVE